MPNFSKKDPSFMYSVFGGLERIIYPTGGKSEITYEQNIVRQRFNKQGSGPYYEPCPSGDTAVGGVRVKRIDNYGDGMSDYVEYSYELFEDNSSSSGILMYMPLYGMRTDYRMILLEGSNIIVKALGFTDECDTAPRYDPVVVYPQVKEIFANGSYNTYKFEFQEDVYPHTESNYKVLAKNIGRDQILLPDEDDSYYAQAIRNYLLPPMMDFSRTRGRLKEKCEYDASGKLMKSESVIYDTYLASSRLSYFNTLLDFVEMDCKWYSSRISDRIYKSYYGEKEFVNWTSYFYNSAEQIEEVRQSGGNSSKTTNYRYLHETAADCPQWLKSAVSRISYSVKEDGVSYQTGLRDFGYDLSSGNPNPVSSTEYSTTTPRRLLDVIDLFATPADCSARTRQFTYDDKFRLTHADYPGGAYVQYIWDSDRRHIISKETDFPENIWRYDWKDMVGPTKITNPKTSFYLFEYDFHNRLSGQKDLNRNYMYRYYYHLNNE